MSYASSRSELAYQLAKDLEKQSMNKSKTIWDLETFIEKV